MLDIEIFIVGMVFVHSVHVIQDLHYAFILGLDFLRTNHVTIDYATNTLNIATKINMHTCPIIADTGLALTTSLFPSVMKQLSELRFLGV